jgi:hypothetical protein
MSTSFSSKKSDGASVHAGGLLAMVSPGGSIRFDVTNPSLAPNAGDFHVAFTPPTPGRHPRPKRETEEPSVPMACYLYVNVTN